MSDQYTNEPLLDMFLFETSQLIEQLEQSVLISEQENCFTEDAINEIFRIMHTIKGSAAMMMFDNIASLAHAMEDLFFYLRKENPKEIDCSAISDLVLEGVDFIKNEVNKIQNNDLVDGNSDTLINKINECLNNLKQINITSLNETISLDETIPLNEIKPIDKTDVLNDLYIAKGTKYNNEFKAIIHFDDDCEMENIHAFSVINKLKKITSEFSYIPADIIDCDESIEVIRNEGFQIYLKSDESYENISNFFMRTIFLKELELVQFKNEDEQKPSCKNNQVLAQKCPIKLANAGDTVKIKNEQIEKETSSSTAQQSIISVNVAKLDKLMDLVGEMVIAETMVLRNPDLQGLELSNFKKSANQLTKITTEIQDIVMSVRMVPLSITFNKMHRIVRDMCKKLDKEVQLEIIGSETEVDKNIIEHISDPLMHLVRNAIDHGIDTDEERQQKGKPIAGVVTLEAKNVGSDVLIIVKDDGMGLNRSKILKKAKENNLIYKDEDDMSDNEVFNLILLPGFSTNDKVTEFSGRGVGMDVVAKNIESVGGTVSIESIEDKGTTITMKIPLTLAIIDGMNIKIGDSCYTIPTMSIKEFFKPNEDDIFTDPDGNEMIMVRGQCYQIRRLHEMYKANVSTTDFSDGILIMVEQNDKIACLFADELLGQQQVVVKSLPKYIQSFKKTKGLAGCTLLGDGSISLILDVSNIFSF